MQIYVLNNQEFRKIKITLHTIKQELSFQKIDIQGVNLYHSLKNSRITYFRLYVNS